MPLMMSPGVGHDSTAHGDTMRMRADSLLYPVTVLVSGMILDFGFKSMQVVYVSMTQVSLRDRLSRKTKT